MKKILIFKTDRLGDLINISPIILNLKKNYPLCEITLICSNYNRHLAEYYKKDIKLIVYKKPFFFFYFKNFFKKKYDIIFQLDGKNHSYLTSILINSDRKLCIRFLKNKKIFNINFKITRPNYFLNFFFNNSVLSIENYNLTNNKEFHYLNLYLTLLKNINIKIKNTNHYLPFDNPTKISFFKDEYILIHVDKRWESFHHNIILNLLNNLDYLSNNNNLIITSNIGSNKIFKFIEKKLINNQNIKFIDEPDLHYILSLVYFSKICVSSHSGLIIHSAAAFKKKIVDVVPPDIFNELDRWIPLHVEYQRFDINKFYVSDFNFKF